MLKLQPEAVPQEPGWHLGEEQTVPALGRVWTLSRQTRRVWRHFADWARTVLPDPIEAVSRHIDKLAEQDLKVMRQLMKQDRDDQAENGPKALALAPLYAQLADVAVDRAIDKACSYLSFGGPELSSLMYSPVGLAKMVQLLLMKYHPAEAAGEAGEDLADDIVNELGAHRLGQLLKVAGGYAPALPKNEGAGREASPLAPASASAGLTGSPSTPRSSAKSTPTPGSWTSTP